MVTRRAPKILVTTTSLRPSNKTPIHGSTGNWYAIYGVEIPPPIRFGDLFDVSYSLHVTNDAFRPDNNPVIWETQVVLATSLSDSTSGTDVLPQVGPHRIGDAAHHALVVDRGLFVSPGNYLSTRYIKLLAWFKHPDANGSQDMECPDNNLGMQCLRYRS